MTARDVVLTALLIAPGAASPQEMPEVRADLEALEVALERAVGQVSHARAGFFAGGEGARGYHLKGYGAVIVLAPRALPRPRKVIVLTERGIQRAVPAERPRARGQDPDMDAIVAQVELFQREAEAQRREAEQMLQEAIREMRERAAAPPQVPATAAAPVPPAPAAPPTPPAAPAPPPPWRFWFGTGGDEDPRPAERIVSDVRSAVTAALESQGPRLRVLGPDEFVVVAVDFVPGVFFAESARPERTLVVRVRKKELDQRRAGKIAPEELRKRIEYVEY